TVPGIFPAITNGVLGEAVNAYVVRFYYGPDGTVSDANTIAVVPGDIVACYGRIGILFDSNSSIERSPDRRRDYRYHTDFVGVVSMEVNAVFQVTQINLASEVGSNGVLLNDGMNRAVSDDLDTVFYIRGDHVPGKGFNPAYRRPRRVDDVNSIMTVP